MIYLFGWNPVAEFIADELTALGEKVDGVVVDERYLENHQPDIGYRVYPIGAMRFNSQDIVYNCLGYRSLSRRIDIGDHLESIGVLRSFISRDSLIYPGCNIRSGTTLVGNVIIERNCVIGEHCLLWGGARICHDSRIGRGVFMAAGSIVGGQCEIGDTASIGFNSSVKEKSCLPSGVSVGANRFYIGSASSR